MWKKLLVYLFTIGALSNIYSQVKVLSSQDTVIAKSYIDSAKIYSKKYRNDIAIVFMNKAVEIYENLLGKDSEFLVDLYYQKGNYINITLINERFENVEKAIRIIKLKYGDNDKRLRRPINIIGNLCFYTSEYEKGVKYLKQYLKLFKNESYSDQYSNTFDQLGQFFIKLHEPDSAILYFTKAIDILKEAKIDSPIKIKLLKNFLSAAYFQNGEFEKSLTYKTPAELMIPDSYYLNFNTKDTSKLLDRLGFFAIKASEKEEHFSAINYYTQYLNILKIYSPTLVKAITGTLLNIGNEYVLEEEFEKAYNYYKEASEIALNKFPEDKRYFIGCLEKMAHCQLKIKKYNEALVNYTSVLKLRKQIDSLAIESADTYRNIAGINVLLEQFEKADSFFYLSLNISQSKKNDNLLNLIYSDLALFKYELNNYEKSIYYIQKSFEICGYNNNKRPENIRYIQTVISNIDILAKIKTSQYANKKSDELLDSVINLYNNAIQLIEINRKRKNDYSGDSYFSNYKGIYERSIKASLLKSDQLSINNYIDKAFLFAEKTKSFSLLEAVKKNRFLKYAGIPDSILKQEQYFIENIARLNRLIFENKENADSKPSKYFTNLTLDESRLQGRYTIYLKDLETRFPAYYSLKYNTDTLSIPDLQHNLITENSCMLSYFMGDSSILIFVIKKDKIEYKIVSKEFDLENLVGNLIKSMTQYKINPLMNEHLDSLTNVYIEASTALYKKLILPVASLLKENVMILPDGVLGYIPFEALLVDRPKNPKRFEQYNYFLKEHKISYCYSATMLLEMKNKQFDLDYREPLNAYAPFFNVDTTNLTGVFAFSDNVRKELNPLFFSGEEVIGINKVMKGKYFISNEANKENFINTASSAKLLHLATHAQANDKTGDFCFLVFSPKNDSIKDNILYAKDIYNLKLNADLVTLSACETGIGELKKGEGIISLARAFAYAGAKSIVTSLWQISDAKTKDLMIDFYKNLKKGMSKDEALWQAKMDYLAKNKGEAASPFYWAAFIGIGDMSKL